MNSYWEDEFLNEVINRSPVLSQKTPVKWAPNCTVHFDQTFADLYTGQESIEYDEIIDDELTSGLYQDIQVLAIWQRYDARSEKQRLLEVKGHLPYQYRYLESNHVHDKKDVDEGFVNYIMPDSYCPGTSPGDFDEVLMSSLHDAANIPKGLHQSEAFDWSPLPLSTYTWWLPLTCHRHLSINRSPMDLREQLKQFDQDTNDKPKSRFINNGRDLTRL